MEKLAFTLENHLFVPTVLLLLPIVKAILNNSNRKLPRITFGQHPTHMLATFRGSFFLRKLKIHLHLHIAEQRHLSLLLTCLKLFLIIMWLVTLKKGAKGKSDRVPSCCALSALPAYGRWVLGSETQLQWGTGANFPFRCDPVWGRRLVCLNYTCSRGRVIYTLIMLILRIIEKCS